MLDLPSSLWCLGSLNLMHMESFFYYMALQSTAFFPIPSHLPLYSRATFGGGEVSAWQTGWFHYGVSSPRLLKDIFIRSLCVWKSAYAPHNMWKPPGRILWEVTHSSLPVTGHPGVATPPSCASPGLALWFLTLSGKCLCFNRHNFQLSPCALEVSLSHPEQICLFFFFPFFICSSELAAE